jgi:hypothetical protein
MAGINKTPQELNTYYKFEKAMVPGKWFDDFEWFWSDDDTVVLHEKGNKSSVGSIIRCDGTVFNVPDVFSVRCGQKVVIKKCLSAAVCELYDFVKQQRWQAILDDTSRSYEWDVDTRNRATVKYRATGKVVLSVVRYPESDPSNRYEIYWSKSGWCIAVCGTDSPYYNRLEKVFSSGDKQLSEPPDLHSGSGKVCIPCVWRDPDRNEHLGLYDSRTGELYGTVSPFKGENGNTGYLCSCGGCCTTETTLEAGKSWVCHSTAHTIDSKRNVIASPDAVVEEVMLSLMPYSIKSFTSEFVIYQTGYKKWEVYSTKTDLFVGYIDYLDSNEQYQAGTVRNYKEFVTYDKAVDWLKKQLMKGINTRRTYVGLCNPCFSFYLEESKKGD